MSETTGRLVTPMFEATLNLQRRYIDLVTRAAFFPLETMTRMPVMAPARGMTQYAQRSAREEIVPVGEEVLHVGKQVIAGETTRVIRTVVESPIEQQVELVTESVVVERRQPTTSVVGATDVLSDRTLEMTATSERPIVSKQRRLVEEVVLHRRATTHVETIRERIKRDHIAVEQPNRLPAVIARPDERRAGSNGEDHKPEQRQTSSQSGQQART